jgi:hypothetical protein
MKPAKIRTAFILGAGLGARLRPLTENCPKPLLPIGGRPLITFAMDHCLSIGVGRFIVNTHHCAAAYDETFPDGNWRGTPILFRHEPVLLDTAGGLKNIEDLIEEEETILVYNGDILSDLPLSRLLAAHTAGGREVTLALRSSGPLRNVCLDARGEICDFRDLLGNRGVRRCLFSGISVVEKRFLRRLIPGKAESTIPVYAAMIREAPGSVDSVVIDQGSWEDIGDPEAYARIAEAAPALRYEGAARATGGNASFDSRPLIAASSGVGGKSCRFAHPVPGSRVESENPFFPTISGSPLETADSSAHPRTVAPEDARGVTTAAPSTGEQEETGLQVSVFIRETLGLAAGTRVEMAPVGKGGSDRAYFRVVTAGRVPAVLIDFASDELNLDAVVIDNRGGARAAVEHLIGLGHRRIAHLAGFYETPELQSRSVTDRLGGYRETLAAHGLPCSEELIVSARTPEERARALKTMLSRPNRPTALFCFSDWWVPQAVTMACELGLCVPQDLSIVGFGGTPELAGMQGLALTTLEVDLARIGSEAARMLIERINGLSTPARRVVVSATLAVGNTTAPPSSSLR